MFKLTCNFDNEHEVPTEIIVATGEDVVTVLASREGDHQEGIYTPYEAEVLAAMLRFNEEHSGMNV